MPRARGGAIGPRMKRLIALALVGVAFVVACGSSGRDFDGAGPQGSPNGSPGDGTEFGATDAGGDTRQPSIGTLTGKVVMPEGTIPLSDALVYLSPTMPPPI